MNRFSLSSLEGSAQVGVLTPWSLFIRQGVPSFASPGPWDPAPGFPPVRPVLSSQRVTDFSICSLLAPESSQRSGEAGRQKELGQGVATWGATPLGCAWIHCSRFKPPHLAKTKRGGSSGQVSRSPRVPFSAAQISILEENYRQTRYLSSGQVGELAALLGLSETQVKIWFQNRRARERRDFLKEQPTSSTALEGAEPVHPTSLGLVTMLEPHSASTLLP